MHWVGLLYLFDRLDQSMLFWVRHFNTVSDEWTTIPNYSTTSFWVITFTFTSFILNIYQDWLQIWWCSTNTVISLFFVTFYWWALLQTIIFKYRPVQYLSQLLFSRCVLLRDKILISSVYYISCFPKRVALVGSCWISKSTITTLLSPLIFLDMYISRFSMLYLFMSIVLLLTLPIYLIYRYAICSFRR